MSNHFQESRKLLIERRRQALIDAGLMDTPTQRSECEHLLSKTSGKF